MARKGKQSLAETVDESEIIESGEELGSINYLIDEDYAIRELEGLAEKAEEGFVVETKKHQFSIPTITLSEIKNITASLSEMKAQISRRVSRVV